MSKQSKQTKKQPKSVEESRSNRIMLSVSDSELQKLEAEAVKMGKDIGVTVKVATCVRALALRGL